jgi:predicted nucleic acid-binding protein
VARSPVLLDSSAVFALIEDEAGADRVEEVLREGDALLPWLALLEVHYITRQEAGEEEADRRLVLLKGSGCEIVWEVDEALVLAASALKAEHRLSLADALIAAYARRRGAVLLHKDPEFEAVAGTVAVEALPYKSSAEDSTLQST